MYAHRLQSDSDMDMSVVCVRMTWSDTPPLPNTHIMASARTSAAVASARHGTGNGYGTHPYGRWRREEETEIEKTDTWRKR